MSVLSRTPPDGCKNIQTGILEKPIQNSKKVKRKHDRPFTVKIGFESDNTVSKVYGKWVKRVKANIKPTKDVHSDGN
jgi:hypothetical protein